MAEEQSAPQGTTASGATNGSFPARDQEFGAVTDLRRTGIDPNFWYPVAVSKSVRKNKTFAATFAGERIALYRGASGKVYALEDRCAHRQVPLSMGVVEGEALRCCYHAWAYRGNGRISQIPYLPKGVDRPPRGVRAYPIREAYGLVFVFPGDPEKAATTTLPELPEFASAGHRTMTFSRTVQCHYTFMHENLLDMNHQFLHRGVLGRIQPQLLGFDTGPRSVEARYLFVPAGGRRTAVPVCCPPRASAAPTRPMSSPSAPSTPTRPSRRFRRTPNSPRSPSGWPMYRRTSSSASPTSTAC